MIEWSRTKPLWRRGVCDVIYKLKGDAYVCIFSPLICRLRLRLKKKTLAGREPMTGFEG